MKFDVDIINNNQNVISFQSINLDNLPTLISKNKSKFIIPKKYDIEIIYKSQTIKSLKDIATIKEIQNNINEKEFDDFTTNFEIEIIKNNQVLHTETIKNLENLYDIINNNEHELFTKYRDSSYKYNKKRRYDSGGGTTSQIPHVFAIYLINNDDDYLVDNEGNYLVA